MPVERLGRLLDEWTFAGTRSRLPHRWCARSSGGSASSIEVGLGYLTLDRGSNTLSGGELQRARLATQLGAGLVGVCYVLDEPTAGLHPRDTERLIASLRALRDQGNSVIVVEHDEAVIRAAELGRGSRAGRGA